MRLAWLVLLACLAPAASAPAQMIRIDPGNRTIRSDMVALPVAVGGRVLAQPRSWRHQWPGVYFETGFIGDWLALRFDDVDNEYRLMIDDRPPLAIVRPGRAEASVTGLADGPHRIRLEKLTESSVPAAFQGFYAPAGTKPLPTPRRTRQIEFIGDSSMAGYGDRSDTTTCTQEEARRLGDVQSAYPALVAKRFDADYQINAVSGRGLVRNYADILPDQTLPSLYPRVLLDRGEPYADPAWRPEIVVIKLNADFVTPVGPGTRWPNIAALGANYVKGFAAFLADLHRRSPDAAFLVWWFDEKAVTDLNSAIMLASWRQDIAAAAKATGIGRIEFLPMKDLGFDRAACDSHPSLADHRKTAAWLGDWIAARPELWRGR